MTQPSLSTNLQPGNCIIWYYPESNYCAYKITKPQVVALLWMSRKVRMTFRGVRDRSVVCCVMSMRHAGWRLRGAMDLFRLSILFSRYRSCDETHVSILFQSWTFSYSNAVFFERSLFNEHDKSSNLLRIVT